MTDTQPLPSSPSAAVADTPSPVAERRVRARIADELKVPVRQVDAAVDLLDGGATVPFVARYRKEATGGLDDTQLRTLEERLTYLRELEARRAAVLSSIAEQGKLTDVLAASIDAAQTKQEVEDLYLPYKQKRRTKAQIAREAGLEPLAEALLADRGRVPQDEAAAYVSAERGVADVKAALDGARDILCERFAERPEVLNAFREFLWEESSIASKRSEGAAAQAGAEAEKFRDYFDHAEPIRGVPSHRALALFRGRQQGVLSLGLTLGEEREALLPHPCVARLAGLVGLGAVLSDGSLPADRWLSDVLRWCWRVKLQLHFESELFGRLREAAETEAIRVFAANLKDLLLGAPAGQKSVMGLDPGLRTGVKVAVVDATGKLLETATVYPHEPRKDWDGTLATLARLAARHRVELVAIGNGTASRETDRLAGDLQKRHPELSMRKVMVSEAGASVYSASALAAREFPELDVSLRGAVSIARRLQDPLAELVKIDPKSIGVGQYQHDVDQRGLARSLDAVVEDCVNAVGVDVNTASVPLLARVSGLNASIAERIVAHRDANGPFRTRESLRQVPRLGDKTFEQAAGFLRIQGGEDPLDASAVHPEAYAVVQRILGALGQPAAAVIGHKDALRGLSAQTFVDERFGLPTVRDIFVELEKPGRDPRGDFVTASFREGIERVADLEPGMILEGVVTNVANFGAFVDIGVHQDGLVHVSALSSKFVREARDVVKAGQLVRVKVLEVDLQRQRIALTMRLDDEPGRAERGALHGARGARDAGRGGAPTPGTPRGPAGGGAGRGAGGPVRGPGSGGQGGGQGAGRGTGAPRAPQLPSAMQAAFESLKKR
ncbi:MAG: RNA-binding transcriptional accessory protein [Burkholderiales bacterium]|nr:MAG: RNA-binding transcriptional accessory protein [Burkholderiales bacterium]